MDENQRRRMVDSYQCQQKVGIAFTGLVSVALVVLFVATLRRGHEFFAVLSQGGKWLYGGSLLILGGLMLTALFGLFRLVRRKHSTGRFCQSYDEAVQFWKTRFDSYGPGKPFWAQASYWLVPLYLNVLAIIVLGMIFVLISSCGKGMNTPRLLFWLVVLMALSFPVSFVLRALWRKRKTGSFLPTPEEMRQSHAKIFAQAPGWQKWGSIVLVNLWGFAAMMNLTRPIADYLRHRPVIFFSGISSLFWISMAVLVISQQCTPSKPKQLDLTRAILVDAGILPEEAAVAPVTPMKQSTRLIWMFVPFIVISLISAYFDLASR